VTNRQTDHTTSSAVVVRIYLLLQCSVIIPVTFVVCAIYKLADTLVYEMVNNLMCFSEDCTGNTRCSKIIGLFCCM